MNNDLFSNSNISGNDSDSLFGSDIMEGPDYWSSNTEETGESEDLQEDRSDSYDYSSDLQYINSTLDVISGETESLVLQVDNLNSNLVTFQSDHKILVGLVFCIVFYLLIKIGFTIFNKVLGLNQA